GRGEQRLHRDALGRLPDQRIRIGPPQLARRELMPPVDARVVRHTESEPCTVRRGEKGPSPFLVRPVPPGGTDGTKSRAVPLLRGCQRSVALISMCDTSSDSVRCASPTPRFRDRTGAPHADRPPRDTVARPRPRRARPRPPLLV